MGGGGGWGWDGDQVGGQRVGPTRTRGPRLRGEVDIDMVRCYLPYI